MKVIATHDKFIVLEHRGYTVLAAKGDIPKGAERELRVKFSREVQNLMINEIIDEVEGVKDFHKGDESQKEICIEKLLYILSTPFWCIPVYQVKAWDRVKKVWNQQTYQYVRWNTGVDSGIVVLSLTTDQKVVFVDEFRHSMRHQAALSQHISGFSVPRYGLRTELIRGLRLPKPGTSELESFEDGALRIASNVAGVKPTENTKVVALGTYDADTGVLCQHARCFAVTNVEADESRMRPDLSEAIYGHKVLSLREVGDMMRSDEIRCGFAHHSILRAMLLGVINSSALSA